MPTLTWNKITDPYLPHMPVYESTFPFPGYKVSGLADNQWVLSKTHDNGTYTIIHVSKSLLHAKSMAPTSDGTHESGKGPL